MLCLPYGRERFWRHSGSTRRRECGRRLRPVSAADQESLQPLACRSCQILEIGAPALEFILLASRQEKSLGSKDPSYILNAACISSWGTSQHQAMRGRGSALLGTSVSFQS